MTKITISKTDKATMGFVVAGHSGYSDAGSDIVCAGISALTINFVNSVERLTKDKFHVKTDDKKGYLSFCFDKIPSDDSSLLMASLVLGLEHIQEEYGDFISIDYKEA